MVVRCSSEVRGDDDDDAGQAIKKEEDSLLLQVFSPNAIFFYFS